MTIYLNNDEGLTAERIMESIEKLAEDPIPHDSKRVIGLPMVSIKR